MYLGEMALLTASVLVMTGLVKEITARLGFNDFTAAFMIFLIVWLNVRGSVRLTEAYSLSVGGVLSVLAVTFSLFRRSESGKDLLLSFFSLVGTVAITFVYSLEFLERTSLDPRTLATLLSIPTGLWCALSGKRTFATCLFSAVTGGFLGIMFYQLFFRKSGNIGGSYAFTVMWFSALFGLILQYLLTAMMRAVKSPRADSYFEAGEMRDEEEEKEK